MFLLLTGVIMGVGLVAFVEKKECTFENDWAERQELRHFEQQRQAWRDAMFVGIP